MQTKYLLSMLLPVIAFMIITPAAFANNGIGATVTKGLCAMIDPNDPTSFQLPGKLNDVITPSGMERISCHGKADYNGQAIHYDSTNALDASGAPLQCFGVAGTTTSDWHEEVSASGQVSLTCDFTGVTPP